MCVFYIKFTVQTIDKEGTLYYCVACHGKDSIARKYYVKGVGIYNKANTSILQNHIDSNHQHMHAHFVEYINLKRAIDKE